MLPLLALSVNLAVAVIAPQANAAEAGRMKQMRRIPPPPMIVMPLSKIEPPKDRPAEEWRAPYCLRWNDGCVECERKERNSKVSCQKLDSENKDCIRTFSLCKHVDSTYFGLICQASWGVHFFMSDYNSEKESPEQFLRDCGHRIYCTGVEWSVIFEWSKRNTWSRDTQSGTLMFGSLPPHLLYLKEHGEEGVYCGKSFSSNDVEQALRDARNEISRRGHGALWDERQQNNNGR